GMSDYRHQRNPFVPTAHQDLAQAISLFVCPAEPGGPGPFNTYGDRIVGVTNFIGVLGTQHGKTDGVLYKGSNTKFGDISDGTSHTLMVGERPPAANYWYGWWYVGVGMESTGSPNNLLGVAEVRTSANFTDGCGAGPYQFGPAKRNDQCDVFHYWS